MSEPLPATRIIGGALLLFSSILLGVGIHHIVATGTCSSTGYSAHYGPVQHCPAGTGTWFAFVFGGIIGSLAGGMLAGGSTLFAGIFGGIGIGALTLGFQHGIDSSTKTFGIAFGAPFTIVGLVAAGYAVSVALGALRESSAGGGRSGGSASGSAGKTRHPSRGSSPVATNAVTPVPRPIASPLSMPTPAVIGGSFGGAATSSANSVTELSQLAELHRQGALSDAEFATAKARIIGGTGA